MKQQAIPAHAGEPLPATVPARRGLRGLLDQSGPVPWGAAARSAAALLLVAHALSHLPGFLMYWQLGTVGGIDYSGALLDGWQGAPELLLRAVGVLWLVATAGFVAGAVGILGRRRWARPLLLGVAGLSILLCLLSWPDARLGLAISGVIAAVLLPPAVAGAAPATPGPEAAPK